MEVVDSLVQFGVAGLMGMLWMWERMHSRQRDTQITEAHERLMHQSQELTVLTQLVSQNTEALISFESAQHRMCQLLEDIAHEMRKSDRAA